MNIENTEIVFADTIVDFYTISVDTVWDKDGSPYFLNGDLTISAGASLTLLPGTRIFVRADTSGSYEYVDIFVQGALISRGTSSEGVLLTREGDSDMWGHICVETGGTLDMEYTEFSHAYWGIDSHSSSSTSPNTVRLDHCAIHDMGGDAVHLGGYHAEVVLTGNEVASNVYHGLYIEETYDYPFVCQTGTIEGNVFTGNQGRSVRVDDIDYLNIFGGNTFDGNGTDGVAVAESTLDNDLVWGANGGPDEIHLEGDLTVSEGATLTLRPGTRIFVRTGDSGIGDYASILVHGALASMGTASEGVLLTREGDSGQWGHIGVQNGGTLDMAYTEFSHAYWGIDSHSSSSTSPNTVRLDHCAIHDMGGEAVHLGGYHAEVVLTGNEVASNVYHGLYIEETYDYPFVCQTGTIEGNVFTGSQGYGARVDDIDYLNIFGGNTFDGNGTDGVAVAESTLDNDLVWGANGDPDEIHLEGDLTVSEGATLTLRPGTRIFVRTGDSGIGDYASILVHGALASMGTASEGVLLTREGDSGQWGHIGVLEGGTLDMAYTEFSHAYWGIDSHSTSSSSPNTVQLDHCHIHDMGGEAIHLSGYHADVVLTGNEVASNVYHGLYIEETYDYPFVCQTGTIEGNVFTGSQGYGVRVDDIDYLSIFGENTFEGSGTDGVAVAESTLDNDLVWGANGGPDEIHLEGDLAVSEGATLTLRPGTRIFVRTGDSGIGDYASILVQGALASMGTTSEEVLLTREGDSGQWGHIGVLEGGTLDMAYTEVSHASSGIDSYSTSSTSPNTVRLDHCAIHDIGCEAVHLSGYHADVVLTGNAISSNACHVLYIEGMYDPFVCQTGSIEENVFSGSQIDGVRVGDIDYLGLFGSNTFEGGTTYGLVVAESALDSDLVWGANGDLGGVRLEGDVTVTEGATLTLLPGTRIFVDVDDYEMGDYVDIIVHGALVSRGTVSEGVLLTRNGDSGQWGHIGVLEGGTLDMAYTEFSYASSGIDSYSTSSTSPNTVRLDHCAIHDIGCEAVHLSGYHADVVLTGNAISSNACHVLYIEGTYDPFVCQTGSIEENVFSGSQIDGVRVGDIDYLGLFGSNTFEGGGSYGLVVAESALDSDLAWGANGDPGGVRLEGDVTVTEGATLTLLPGTRIFVDVDDSEMGDYVDILVHGALASRGTVSEGVLLTRNGDSGQWGHIGVLEGGTLDMEYTEVSYASSGIDSYSTSSTSPNTVRLDHCDIHDIGCEAVHLSGYHANVVLTGNAISSNACHVLYIEGMYDPFVCQTGSIEENVFSGNQIDAVRVGDIDYLGLFGSNTFEGGTTYGLVVAESALDSDLVWGANGDLGEVRLEGDVTVSEDATLTLMPGTRIYVKTGDSEMGDYADILVYGALASRGTASEGVLLTRDGDSGEWGHIGVLDGGSLDMEYTEVSHAIWGINSDGSSSSSPNTFRLDHCDIHDVGGDGVTISGYHDSMSMHYSNLRNCAQGVLADLSPSGTVFDATYNFWGDASGPYDPEDDRADGGDYNPNGGGLFVGSNVEYRPWLGDIGWAGVDGDEQDLALSLAFTGSKANGDGTYTAFYDVSLAGDAAQMEWDFENDGIVDRTTEPFNGAFSSVFDSSGIFTTIVVAKTESGNSVQRSVRATVGLGSADLVVFVRDENGDPISEAQVNLDGTSLAWNGAPDNYYLLTGMPPDDYDLEIAANGYITHYEKTSLLDGSNSKEVFLTPADGGGASNPHICNVKIGVPKGTYLGNNKWVEHPVFLSGAGTEASSSSLGSFEALFMPEVNWNGTIPAVVRVHHSIDGQLDYDWNDIKASGIAIDVARLSPGQTVGFQAISEGNELSEIHTADMEIAETPLAPCSMIWKDGKYVETESLALDFIKESFPDGIMPASSPIFGGEEFGVNILLKFKREVEIDGTGYLSVGSKTGSLSEILEKAYLTFAGKQVSFVEPSTGSGADIAKKEKISATPRLNVSMDWKNANWAYDGDIGLALSGQWLVPPYYVWKDPPVYARAGAGLGLDAAMTFIGITKGSQKTKTFTSIIDGSFVYSPEGSLTGGLSAAEVLSAELTGKIQLDWGMEWPFEDSPTKRLDLSLYWTAKYQALAFEKEIDLERGRLDLLATHCRVGTALYGGDDISPDGFVLSDRDYLGSGYAKVPTAQDRTRLARTANPEISGTETIVLENVYPRSGSVLRLASSDGSAMKVLTVADDPARNSVNRTVLKALDLDGSGMIDSDIAIMDDGTGDFHPAAVTLPDGRILAIWNDLGTVQKESVTLEQCLADMDISSAIYSPAADQWQYLGKIIDNDHLDRNPNMCLLPNSTAVAAWVDNPGNTYQADDLNPDRINVAFWQNGSWTSSAMIAQATGAALRLTVGAIGEEPVVVWEEDLDFDLSTFEDRELFSCRQTGGQWQGAEQLTNNGESDTNPTMTLTPDGTTILAWGRGNSIVYTTDTNCQTVKTVVAETDASGMQDFTVIPRYPKGAALIWTDASSQEETDIFISVYDDAEYLWGGPRRLTLDADLERGVSGEYGPDGTLYLSYNKVSLKEDEVFGLVPDRVDLAVFSYTESGDLTASKIEFGNPSPCPGETVSVYGTFVNSGERVAKGVPVEFRADDISFASDTVSGPVAPGDEITVEASWTVPEQSGIKVSFEVDPGQSLEDRDRSDNSIDTTVVKANLLARGTEKKTLPNGDVIVKAELLNRGNANSSGFDIVIARIENNFETGFIAERISDLAIGEVYEAQWNVPDGEYVLYLDAENEIEEENEDDNVYGFGSGLHSRCVSFLSPEIINGNTVDFTVYVPLNPWDITSFSWDLDGDGIADVVTSENYLRHAYSESGTYQVRVVIDIADEDDIVLGPLAIAITRHVVPGDVDGGGTVEIQDGLKIMQAFSGNIEIELDIAADVNNDSIIDSDELRYILEVLTNAR